MSEIKMIRNLMSGYHRKCTRIWIEPTALEAAGFSVGDYITQTVTGDAIILRLSNTKTKHSVSKRKKPSWEYERPLYETCNQEITLVIKPRERIDILVSQGMLVIKKERSFDLFVINTPHLQGSDLKKLRLYSAPSGCGLATAAAVSTGLYEAVGGIDIWNDAIDAYRCNFNKGSVFLGDLVRLHNDYIPNADVCWLSPSCVEYSSLGTLIKGIAEGHSPHYARIVYATGAKAVMVEQVPSYFKSNSYAQLLKLLKPYFPYVYEKIIDAYDIGSVANRKRGYTVLFRDLTEFQWPELPSLPEHRRKTVKQVIGREWETGEWRTIKDSVMYGLLHKEGDHNFKSSKNHTLVGLESKRISAIVSNYRKYQVTSSYLKHPEREEWRPFNSCELARFLNVPNDYVFPDWMNEGLKTKLLGQGVDCNVAKMIQVEVAVALMGFRYQEMQRRMTTLYDKIV
ncbi:DNA cytosine methyltransferase [Paenibacillus alvei]|uniref:DNA (cytosine-5-)-methyltransferase n=1 Tax=Paenibacillus alvei TaxID=44250 RepID=A0ABT4H4G0_PAEAL|nr:DNA cytosine methyltransferase [Paenibacillus alvei]MCY9763527.1 DNA cytosine methyltransferase [Paenibacillus alvei]MCY9765286.1 DNA cytosine methyltransferase [Paenibacillus alvei]